MNTHLKYLFLASSLSLAGVNASAAAEEMTFKLTHAYPAAHYLWEAGGKVMAEEITKASNSAIKFEYYPAGQLGKDYVALLKSGIADIAIIAVSSFSKEVFPLSSVAELPGVYKTACEGTEKFWQISKEGGALSEVEFAPNDLHILFVLVQVPYTIMTSKKEITKLEDLQGLKIRGNGAAHERLLTSLGAVPVAVSGVETYDAVSRGTIDGALWPYTGIPQYDLEQVLHYSAEGTALGSGATVYAMTKTKWNSLSPEVQDMFEKASEVARQSMCTYADTATEEIRNDIVKNANFKLNHLSEEELKRWDERTSTVIKAWEDQMNANGLKGTEIFKAFNEAQ